MKKMKEKIKSRIPVPHVTIQSHMSFVIISNFQNNFRNNGELHNTFQTLNNILSVGHCITYRKSCILFQDSIKFQLN